MRAHRLLLAITLVGACTPPAQKPSFDGGPSADGPLAGEGDGHYDVFTCMVEAPTSCPTPAPRFADVKPIIDKWCIGCHNGATFDGPWPLTDYEHVASWADIIRPDMLECTMPPADAGLPPMPNEDRLVILQWLRCGFPP